jgi:diguanylate cyclase (GGDEF)-like protein
VAALRDEFGVRAAWVLALPPIVLGLGLAVRGLHGWWFDVHVGLRLTDDSQGNEMLLLTVLALSTLFQFSLLYLVTFRLLKKLHRLSQQDSLTGLLNRRAWDQALGTERQRLRRRPGPLALLVIDVDHFKRINDLHGHAAGDAALVAVGRALQHVARATDVVARLGGEEFGILLLDTDVPGATAAAERVRHEVSQLQVSHGLEMISFTVSVGAAVQPATESESLRLDELQACADAALYRAKAEGRNRVVIEHFGQQPRLRMA